MNRFFVLREAQHLRNLAAFLDLNWEAFSKAGKPLGVSIAVYKQKRSQEQNNGMWVWLEHLAQHAWVSGQQYSAEVWHEHMKRQCLPEVTARGKRKWDALPDGQRVLAMGTSDLNVEEMSEYMEALCAYAADSLGVELPHLVPAGF